MTDISLDGVELSTAVPDALVTRVRRPLVGRRRHVDVNIPGRAGSIIYTEEPGDRIITVDVDIQSAGFDERRDAVRSLAGWADVGGIARMIVDDEPDRFHEAILENEPDPDEWLVSGEASIDMRAGPFALALVPTVENVDIGSGSFNAEMDRYAYPVIEITPAGGTMTGFALQLNDDTLTWLGSDTPVLDGETVTVSAISDTMTRGANGDTMLVGAFDPEAVDMVDIAGRFGFVVPGANTWAFSATGTRTTVAVDITWRARYH